MADTSDRDDESVSSSDSSSCEDDSESVGGRSFSSADSNEAMLQELASPEEIHLDNMEDQPEVVYATPAPLEQPETDDLAIDDDENMTPSAPNPPTEATPSPAHQDEKPIPRNKYIAHWPISENRAIFVSLDIATGGVYCGIVQLSAEIFVVLYDKHDPNAKPTICHCNDTFNKYINPGENALWDAQCSSVHGLHAQSPEIINADFLFGAVSQTSSTDTSATMT